MDELLQQIAAYKQEIEGQPTNGADSLEAYRIKFLGTKGIVKNLFTEMRNVPADKKKEFGLILNEFKQLAEAKYENWKQQLEGSGASDAAAIDVTLPGDPLPLGTRHPINLFLNHVISIFNRLGFSVAEGPEIEDDWHNFTALNFPPNHPAREMQDTFFIERSPETDVLLRTHTSNVQVRLLEKTKPPVRSIMPGRVYRNEAISARAHCFFHQVEGLYVDRNVGFADLKQTLYHFAKEMYGKDIKIRYRPSFFPFTEPSAEIDISCLICKGKGCNVCKHSGWVEIAGSGMVHPNVLKNCNVDPEEFTGFAFGMGVERVAQLLYNVNDLRLYSENDVRFLKQFNTLI